MKSCLLALLFVLSIGSHTAYAQDTYVSYQTFYDDLAPYGQWIDDAQYGYSFVPNVDEDFRPYFTEGHWVMTEYGNTWASDYSWGWACFHYGRWTFSDYYGWIWIPGDEWGPGWVSWRWGGDYCGWAPMYPGYTMGYDYTGPEDWWIFMHPKHLYKPVYQNMWRADFWRGPSYNHTIITKTTYLNNTGTGPHDETYPYGPRVSQVQDVTHKPVYVYSVKEATTGGPEVVADKDRALTIYRPARIEQLDRDGDKAIPPRVIAAPQLISKPQQVRGATANQPHEFRATYMGRGTAARVQQVRGQQSYGTRPSNNNAPVQQQSAPRVNNAPPRNYTPAPAPQAPRPMPAPAAPRAMPAAPPVRQAPGGGHR